jgi:hypothetical protein
MIKQKITLFKKFKLMSKKDYKRINLWLHLDLYDQIKKNAEESYLRIGTYTRQLIQRAVKNNVTKNKRYD